MSATNLGGNTGKADLMVVTDGDNKSKTPAIDFHYATIADGVATFIKDSEAVAGGSYKVVHGGATNVLANIGDYIILDEPFTRDAKPVTATVLTTAENGIVTKNGNTYTVELAKVKKGAAIFLTLQEAVDSDVEGEVVLLGDYSLDATVTITNNVTVDLAGYTITGTLTATKSYSLPNSGREYMFELGDNTITFKNGFLQSESDHIGAFHAVASTLALQSITNTTVYRAIGAYDGAKVTVDANSTLTTTGEDPTIFIWSNFSNRSDATVQCEVTIAGKVYNTFSGTAVCKNLDAVIMGNGQDCYAGVKLTIADGAVIEGTKCAGIYFPCAGTLAINAATITGTEGVYVKGGAATVVNGATITATGAAGAYAVDHNGHAWTGDAFVIDSCKGYAELGTQSISGGTFTSANGFAVVSTNEAGKTAVAGFISGGTFSSAIPEGLCANGYIPSYDAKTGKYGVKEGYYVARVNGAQGYETLAEAVAAANDGDTVTLIAAVTNGAGIKVAENKFATKGLTVDFGGFTYTATKDPVGSSGTENQVFQLLKGNKVTFTNGTVQVAEASKELFRFIVQNYSSLTLADVTLDGTNLAKPNKTPYTLSNCYGDTTLGSDVEIIAAANGIAFDVDNGNNPAAYPDGANVTVDGATITGNIALGCDGVLTLTSGTLNGSIVNDISGDIAITVTKDDEFEATAPSGYKWNNLGVLAKIVLAEVTIDEVANCTISAKTNGVAIASGAKFDVDDEVVVAVTRTAAEGYELDGCLASENITITESTNITAAVKAILATDITLTDSAIEIKVGSSTNVTATIVPDGTLAKTVTWDYSDLAAYAEVTENGNTITIAATNSMPSGIAARTITVTADSVTKEISVTIVANGPAIQEDEKKVEVKEDSSSVGGAPVYTVESKDSAITTVTFTSIDANATVKVAPSITTVKGVDPAKIKVMNTAGTTEIPSTAIVGGNSTSFSTELKADGTATVKTGAVEETIKVEPEFASTTPSGDPLTPMSVTDTAITLNIKTIPGLTYTILRSTTADPAGAYEVISETTATDEAEGARLQLEAAKTSDSTKFYKVQVTK